MKLKTNIGWIQNPGSKKEQHIHININIQYVFINAGYLCHRRLKFDDHLFTMVIVKCQQQSMTSVWSLV